MTLSLNQWLFYFSVFRALQTKMEKSPWDQFIDLMNWWWHSWLFLPDWETQIMTLRVSDWQSESALDSIHNYCYIFLVHVVRKLLTKLGYRSFLCILKCSVVKTNLVFQMLSLLRHLNWLLLIIFPISIATPTALESITTEVGQSYINPVPALLSGCRGGQPIESQ